jgi:peptidoglycan hydrolase-like protein with peptidoglycan-binding domain
VTVKSIQQRLRQRGWYAGPIDGIAGPKTTAAIRRYQQEQHLLVDGQPSAGLAAHIESNS